MPLAPPASCAAAVAKDESVPLSWCTLLMSTLGLFKVGAAGERCSDQGGGGDGGTCAASSAVLVHDLLAWLLVDLVACLPNPNPNPNPKPTLTLTLAITLALTLTLALTRALTRARTRSRACFSTRASARTSTRGPRSEAR